MVFVDGAGNVVNDWGTSSAWNGPAAIGGTARAGSNMAQDGGGADVVFMNPAGAVVNDWGTSSGWNGPAAIGGTARAGSGIAESDDGGTVAFINPAGQVVNDWGTSTGVERTRPHRRHLPIAPRTGLPAQPAGALFPGSSVLALSP